jgi:hypothetical protein
LRVEAFLGIVTDMPTLTQLKQALVISEQLEELHAELDGLLEGIESQVTATAVSISLVKAKKRSVSAESRARMAATQKARWAKKKLAGEHGQPVADPCVHAT